jgi:hypothetical protein
VGVRERGIRAEGYGFHQSIEATTDWKSYSFDWQTPKQGDFSMPLVSFNLGQADVAVEVADFQFQPLASTPQAAPSR